MIMKHNGRLMLSAILLLCSVLDLARGQCKTNWNRIMALNGTCICMDGYYDIGANPCSACNTNCLTCVTAASNCLSCDSTLHLSLSGSVCVCAVGYVSVAGVCQPCHYTCATCSSTSSTGCLTCNPSVRLLTGTQCICLNGTFDNTTSQLCEPCNSKCLWCASSGETSCTNCDANLLRYMGGSSPGPCLCNNGYYDSTPSLCQTCSYSCLTCNITASTCTSCDPALNRLLDGTSCLCIAHYYDYGQAGCAVCSARCGNCTGYSVCGSCNNTLRILVGSTCPCIAGYYQDSGTVLCQPCTSYCLTCVNSSSTCLSCYNFGNRLLYNATCSCIDGYYDNNTLICVPCSYTCLTCSSYSVCLTCATTTNRLLLNSTCPCADAYYDNGSAVCSGCYFTCQTCIMASGYCTSCNSTAHRTLLANTCVCLAAYYDDGLDCQPCHYSCATCFNASSSSCYTCPSLRNYTNYSCPCISTMYESLQICYLCASPCLTCSYNATYCTSCAFPYSLTSNHSCICSIGYYPAGTVCLPCDYQCESCQVVSSQCTSCKPAMLTILVGNSCVCGTSTYYNNSSQQCTACHHSCLNCTSGSSTACTSCVLYSHRQFLGSTCPCVDGYYDDQLASLCQPCNAYCLTCLGPTQFNCTGCVANYILIGSYCKAVVNCTNYLYLEQCINICPESTYPSNHECLQCPEGCETCQSTVCLTCLASHFYEPNLQSCILQCPVGSYINGTRTCVQCPAECTSCNYNNDRSGIICNSCSATYLLQEYGRCVTACSYGYVQVGLYCHRCIQYCLQCTGLSANSCLKCSTGYAMLNGQCYLVCPDTYLLSIYAVAIINNTLYLNTTATLYCVPCPAHCKTCMANLCKQCTVGYYINAKANTCLQEGLFVKGDNTIGQCHANCKSCTNSSFSSCVMCKQLRGDATQMAISGYCECWDGSVDTGDGKCDMALYKSIIDSNIILVAATESAVYFTALLSFAANNFISLMSFVSYLQVYSNFYYLNSSAVLQTDIILQSYYNINPISYYRNYYSAADQNHNGRFLATTQTDESLYFRGRKWQYLIEWAFPAFAINLVIWSITMIACCIKCKRKSNHVTNSHQTLEKSVLQNTYKLQPYEIQTNKISEQHQQTQTKQGQQQTTIVKASSSKNQKRTCSQYVEKFIQNYHESVAIVFFMFTYSQVTLYSVFSFTNLFHMQTQQVDFQLNIFNTIASLMLIGYYICYQLRLLIGTLRYATLPSQKPKTSLHLLFHLHRKNAKSRLNRMFVPLIVLRNMAIALFVSFLSFNSFYQSITSLSLIIFSTLLNLCICPYEGVQRIFYNLSQIILAAQIGILTRVVSLPQVSRIGPSQILIILNFLQFALIVLISLWISVQLINKKICAKNNKVVNKGNVKRMEKMERMKHEESLSHLNEKEHEQTNEKWEYKQCENVIFCIQQKNDNGAQMQQSRNSSVTNIGTKSETMPKQRKLQVQPHLANNNPIPYKTS